MQGLLNIELICAVKCVATAAISQVQGVTDPVDFDMMGGMSNVAPTTKPRSTWQPQTTTSAVPNWFTKLIWYVHWPTTRKNHCFIPSLSHTHKIALCPFETCCIYSLQQTPTPTRGPQTLPRLAGSACLLAFCAQQGLILKLLAQSEQFESLNVLFVCLVQWCHLQRFEKQQCTCHFREWSHHFLFQAVQPPIHVFSNDHAVITNKQQTQLCVSLIK